VIPSNAVLKMLKMSKFKLNKTVTWPQKNGICNNQS